MSTPQTLETSGLIALFTLLQERGVDQKNLDTLLERHLLEDLLQAVKIEKSINRFRVCQALCTDGSLLPFKIVNYGPAGKQTDISLCSAEDGLHQLKKTGISFWDQDTWSEKAITKRWKKGMHVFGKFLVIEFPTPRLFGGSATQHPYTSLKVLEKYSIDGGTIIELVSFARNLLQLYGQEKTKTQVVALGTAFPPFEDSSDKEPLFAKITFGGKRSPEIGLTKGRNIGRFHENSENDRYLYLVKVRE